MRTFMLAIVVTTTALGCAAEPPRVPSRAEAAQVCHGIPPGERDRSVFSEARDLEPITRKVPSGKSFLERPAGVRAFIPAKPGMTPEYLQRVATCQAAHFAAEGRHDDPLAVPESKIRVDSAGTGFTVTVTSPRVDHGTELYRRADVAVNGPTAAN